MSTVERPWTKTVITDATVEVSPNYYRGSRRNLKAEADDLARDLKKLFDDHATWRGTPISVHYESKIVCMFCTLNYEEDETGVPMCCDKAIQTYEQEKKGDLIFFGPGDDDHEDDKLR